MIFSKVDIKLLGGFQVFGRDLDRRIAPEDQHPDSGERGAARALDDAACAGPVAGFHLDARTGHMWDALERRGRIDGEAKYFDFVVGYSCQLVSSENLEDSRYP